MLSKWFSQCSPGQGAAAAWETLEAHSQASSLRQKHGGGARHRVFDQSLQ